MRRLFSTTALLIFTTAAVAQDATNAVLYVPGGDQNNSFGKVIYDSGDEAPVVAIGGSVAPIDCPDGAFWVMNKVALVSCTGDAAYRFVPPSSEYLAVSKALGLEPIKGPPFGTDDGGPFLNDD